SCFERWHPLSDQARRHAGQDIAAATRGEGRWGVGVDGCPSVRRRDHSVRALQEYTHVGTRCSLARPLDLVRESREVGEQPRELALVWGQQRWRFGGIEQILWTVGEDR